jgi:hypothetical protein
MYVYIYYIAGTWDVSRDMRSAISACLEGGLCFGALGVHVRPGLQAIGWVPPLFEKRVFRVRTGERPESAGVSNVFLRLARKK